MSEFKRKYTSNKGSFVGFKMENGMFIIVRGKGNTVNYVDRFSASSAKQIAYDILGMANSYQRANSGNAKLRRQINDTDIDGKTAEKIIKEVVKQAPETEKTEDIKKVLKGESVGEDLELLTFDNAEKTNEEVSYKIYQVFGKRWFTSKEFKRFYNKRWDKTHYTDMLKNLYKQNRIYKEDLEEDEKDDPKLKKKYRITDPTAKSIEEGRLMSDDNPAWKFKKRIMNDEALPRQA